MRRGSPAGWGEARTLAFAQELARRSHDNERRRRADPSYPAIAAELQRRRQRALVTYSPEARARAMASIHAALVALEERRACAYGSWTPRAELARQLGVSSVRLGRWVARGSVPSEMMPIVSEWAQRRIDQELQRLARMSEVEDLIQRAKRPALAHGLGGGSKQQAARAPDIGDGEKRFENAEAVGYVWTRRVEEFSTFPLITRLEKWALSRRVPRNANIGLCKRWVVTALCSIYDPPDSLLPKDERRQRRRRTKSPGPYRQFDRKSDKHNHGRSLMLGAAISSRTVRRGGLERAVALWLESMIVEHCENELVFVHALIVRNWRGRSEHEQKAYARRQYAEWKRQHEAEERARQRRRSKVRSRAKAKTLGKARRGSRLPSPPRKKRRS